jgi:hypothetical protein
MANTFKNYTSRNVGTSLTPVGSYTVPGATQTTVIGLVCANTTASDITCDVTLYDGVNETYIVKNAPVQVGSSLVAVGGAQKIVLQTGESIRVKSSAATSVDAVMSVLEIA